MQHVCRSVTSQRFSARLRLCDSHFSHNRVSARSHLRSNVRCQDALAATAAARVAISPKHDKPVVVNFHLATDQVNSSVAMPRAQKFPDAASFRTNLSSVWSDTARCGPPDVKQYPSNFGPRVLIIFLNLFIVSFVWVLERWIAHPAARPPRRAPRSEGCYR